MKDYEILDLFWYRNLSHIESYLNRNVSKETEYEEVSIESGIPTIGNSGAFALNPAGLASLVTKQVPIDSKCFVIRYQLEHSLVKKMKKDESFFTQSMTKIAMQMIKELDAARGFTWHDLAVGSTNTFHCPGGNNKRIFRCVENGNVEIRLVSNCILKERA